MFACNSKNENITINEIKDDTSIQVELNLNKGYSFNEISNDSIRPFINASGDTIQTGVPLLLEGTPVFNYSAPTKNKLVDVESYTSTSNRKEIGELKKIHFDLNELQIEEELKGDEIYIFKDDNGKEIPTNTYIEAKANVIPAISRKPSKALSLKFKDSAKRNLQYIDVDEGLNSSYVISVFMDSRGVLWFGTATGGINKYDGKNISYYTVNEGMPYDNIWDIIEDKKGNIWIASYGGGISKYDGKTFSNYSTDNGLISNQVVCLYEDSKGDILIGSTEGFSHFDGNGFTHYTLNEGLSGKIVQSIEEDSMGRIWIATNNGLSLMEGDNFISIFSNLDLPSKNLYSLYIDLDNNIWIGSRRGGVYKIDRFNKSKEGRGVLTIIDKSNGLSSNFIRAIVEDQKGELWLGSYGGGLNKYDGSHITLFSSDLGLSENKIRSLVADDWGNIWIGTYGGGVNKLRKDSFLHFDDVDGLSKNNVRSILEDSQQKMWFGTSKDGLYQKDGNTITHFTNENGLSGNTIYDIQEERSGWLAFADYYKGLYRFDGEYFYHYGIPQGIPSSRILSILEDGNGNLWLGTNKGICKMEFDAKNALVPKKIIHYSSKNGLLGDLIWKIIEDRSGNVWFSSYREGVIKYDGSHFTFFTGKEGMFLSKNYSVYQDASNDMWFGGYPGVCKFDGENFTYYNKDNGLSDNNAWSIIEDRNDDIWVSTEMGLNLLKYDKNNQDNPKIYNYLSRDGLKGLDFFANSAVLDNDNKAWWGSGKSITMLDINKMDYPSNSPRVNLEYIEINGEFIDFHNIDSYQFDSLKSFHNYPENLKLEYDNNHLTFHFRALDWAMPHKVKYSYVLEGLKSSWSKSTSDSKVDYRNLPYGDYTFKVKAIQEANTWGEEFAYSFTIYPPWWHTWWARVFYIILAIVCVILIVRQRTSNLKKRQVELQRKVKVATSELVIKNQEIKAQHDNLESQKKVIEKVHKEITDSIIYAKRIQSAILPPTRIIRDYLKEAFIFYKPKDVVAGDFYWMRKVENRTLFAAADCTGHGVPGALVSVVCNNALNRSVREYGLTDPGEILDKTRDIVIREFEKSEEEVKDGMDIALCMIEGDKIHYAGANLPLWIVRNGEVLITKSTRQPIGIFLNQTNFVTHTFDLKSDDVIYLFTDGIVDQFGGERGKKFKVSGLKKLVLEINHLSMGEQHNKLINHFNNWKGNLEQVDDVCFIGVKV